MQVKHSSFLSFLHTAHDVRVQSKTSFADAGANDGNEVLDVDTETQVTTDENGKTTVQDV